MDTDGYFRCCRGTACRAPIDYATFPPFLEGLLPEGFNLEALLRALKIDRQDLFSQLLAVGKDMVGAVTVREAK